MNRDAVRACYESIHHHSKSFSLASRLLPVGVREQAVVVYAWCRRADDAVDVAGPEKAPAALSRLRAEASPIEVPDSQPVRACPPQERDDLNSGAVEYPPLSPCVPILCRCPAAS